MKELISRAGAFALAAVAGIGITILGEGVWGALAVVNVRTSPQIPWSVGVMAALLAVLIAYLGGSGWPRSNAAERRRLLRWNPVKPSAFRWAILAGLLALAALGGAWIALSDVVHIPAGATPSLRGVPLWSQVALVIMGSLAAPLTEEAAFRGYAMGILERGWKSPWAALIVSSALFAGMHYTQGIDATKLSLYFTVGLILGGVALLTNSLYPAMIVHGLGDVMGFTLLWPHDAPHTLVTQGGRDPLFVPAVATLAICLPASLVAFARLARMTR
ncbi:MAG TPA: CPBP family intramembrane glutamic endopeptidase, partial [Caulobacteraceae bacterium]|nr:CPBP family intramembrane glutamic endopeptidase [Caulobacteraceae bacterium]